MSEARIIFATGNEGKMKEIRLILADLGVEILSMKEADINLDIVEDGRTFSENAQIKAKAVWDVTGGIVLADDSGLSVDALEGEPGIYSARYMGEAASYEIKNQNIIDRVNASPSGIRSARFVCSIAAVLTDGTVLLTEGTMEGVIANAPAGTEGFGYDPILYIPEFQKTSAELSIEQKNKISHRAKALEAMKRRLEECYKR